MMWNAIYRRARQCSTAQNIRQWFLSLQFYLRHLPDWYRWCQQQCHRRPVAPRHIDDTTACHIVFVTNYARAREYKLAYTARLAGHRVTLLASRNQSEQMARDYFDAYYILDNPWHILQHIGALQPDLIHWFAGYDIDRKLPLLTCASVPVVYDPYDCLQGMYTPPYKPNWLKLKAERLCFERADHVCARSLEPLYLRRHFGYQMQGVTYFPEYCWSPPTQRGARWIGPDEALHVVYCGAVWPENLFQSSQVGYAQYIEVARAFAKQKIHLHLYPSAPPQQDTFAEFFALYLEEEKQNPFLHVHHTLPYERLMPELSQYDAALHVFGTSINGSLGRVSLAKQHYSSANKLFDYLEVGLPVLIHRGFHQHGVLRHYSHAIRLEHLDQARERLTTFLAHRQPRDLSSATLTYQAKRLGEMYRQVIKSHVHP